MDTVNETQLVVEIVDELRVALSDDDFERLARHVTLTRYSILRRSYVRTMSRARTPLEKVMSKIDNRCWLKDASIEDHIFRATEQIALVADLSRGESSILKDILIEVENLTGLSDTSDPIVIACCETMFNFMGMSIDGLESKLTQRVRC